MAHNRLRHTIGIAVMFFVTSVPIHGAAAAAGRCTWLSAARGIQFAGRPVSKFRALDIDQAIHQCGYTDKKGRSYFATLQKEPPSVEAPRPSDDREVSDLSSDTLRAFLSITRSPQATIKQVWSYDGVTVFTIGEIAPNAAQSRFDVNEGLSVAKGVLGQ